MDRTIPTEPAVVLTEQVRPNDIIPGYGTVKSVSIAPVRNGNCDTVTIRFIDKRTPKIQVLSGFHIDIWR